MKLARVGIIAAAVLAISSVAFAQTPDFSGTWTPDQPAAQGEGRGRGMGGPMTVKQDATSLTIERTMGENKTTAVYKLDGTESVNKMTMGRGENAREVEQKSTAKWDGAKLVITTKTAAPDGTERTQTQTWWMDGGNLVIERPAGRGGEMQKTVYKKTT